MRQLALVVIGLTLLPTAARALIPEPPHVVRGAVTVNGAPRTWGTVTLRLDGSPERDRVVRSRDAAGDGKRLCAGGADGRAGPARSGHGAAG